MGTEPFIPYSMSAIRNEITARLLITQLKELSRTNFSDRGKIPITAYLIKHKYHLESFSRDGLATLTKLLSGHSSLNYFSSKIGKTSSPFCKFCPREFETSEHFLCVCPAFSRQRILSFGVPVTDFTSLINNITPASILSYTQDTNRFNSITEP